MARAGRVRVPRGYAIDDSSNVRLITWTREDAREPNMMVWFKNGGVYLYKGVSRQRAVAACLAPSVGRYINKVIKPSFEAVKVA